MRKWRYYEVHKTFLVKDKILTIVELNDYVTKDFYNHYFPLCISREEREKREYGRVIMPRYRSVSDVRLIFTTLEKDRIFFMVAIFDLNKQKNTKKMCMLDTQSGKVSWEGFERVFVEEVKRFLQQEKYVLQDVSDMVRECEASQSVKNELLENLSERWNSLWKIVDEPYKLVIGYVPDFNINRCCNDGFFKIARQKGVSL